MTAIHALDADTALTRAGYDSLTCCGQPARIAHGTETLPVPGAICESCWCTVTSTAGYGAASVRRCPTHAH
ncbi:hypothetical protein [Kitasatospora sp. NPDC056531]|uniref:hypothetical protein n=1 Tax=Kitasatospora sp. NPDC056531 TaxID=3345856 RepID=UPI0036B3CBDC